MGLPMSADFLNGMGSMPNGQTIGGSSPQKPEVITKTIVDHFAEKHLQNELLQEKSKEARLKAQAKMKESEA
jgi:hypothetical protein